MKPDLRSIGLLLPLVLAAGCFQATQSLTWEGVRADIATRYPSVRQISTQELADWLADASRPQPLLLDVRAQEEFAVSHLPGAVQVDPSEQTFPLPSEAPRDTPIVTYCSVGHRSSRFAVSLHQSGLTNVFNLDGSIFAWANEGRPLVSEAGSTTKVHPYNRRWGRLLDNRFH